MHRVSLFLVLGMFPFVPLPCSQAISSILLLTENSAKELEHFERIRQSFESVDKKKQNQQEQRQPQQSQPAQTIGEALEALRLSGEQPIVDGIDGPLVNGDGHLPLSMGKGKARHGKGKGKARSKAGSEVDGEVSDEESTWEKEDEDYVVRTDHLQ